MINPPIVIVAFNRPKSLSRLLTSIKKAFYPDMAIPLIISIDYTPNNEDVLKIANGFHWEHGEKKIVLHESNLGLKKHILKCGDYSFKYGSVIILEDDLFVSPNFYFYTLAALRYSKNDLRIAGVSLYNHKINVHKGEYFTALEDGYDNWYFQFASSWGQSWSKNSWQSFKDWFQENKVLKKSKEIPENVLNWSDKSWLKYFIVYLIQENKYFMYPKIALSTNFNDKGTHVGQDGTAYQLELLYCKKIDYAFSNLDNSFAIYDAFFESIKLNKALGINRENVEIDLYGYKPISEKRYFLSSKFLNKKIVHSFARSLKPMEANILENLEGNELFLYDLNEDCKNNFADKNNLGFRRIVYSSKVLSYKSGWVLFKNLLKDRFLGFITKN